MKFEKVEMKREVWVMLIGDKKIPVDMIKNILFPIFIIVCVGLAINVGQQAMTEYVKIAAYVSNNGIYNPQTHLYEKCYPERQGSNVVWRCENTTEITNIYKNTNETIKYPLK
jgi:hypothetical protein